ncbi:type II toxin-antitoxin system Phd/YefM family antitoxin [Candidatus Nitrospira salsa]|nr:MAG: hypothetical protein NPIRA01_26810 [Nitrospirales bacterium]
MQATAKDLRFSSKELLATVSRGEEVVITHRGKPVAKLVPLDSGTQLSSAELKLYGIWAKHQPSQNVKTYVRQLRKPRHTRAH